MRKRSAKKKLGSYPSASVIFSITMALFVAGLFGILMTFSRQLEKVVQENIRIQVYLKRELSTTDVKALKNQLQTTEFLNKTINNPVTFISKEEAAKQFIRDTGEDFYKFMGENPLFDSYVLAVAPSFQSASQLNSIKKRLEKIKGVHFVDYNPNLIESINKNRTAIGVVLGGSSLTLFLVVILLIRNTLRLALFSQRFLIRSMQLVGATRGFITKPFLLRATGYGLTGSVIASTLLVGLVTYANEVIPELRLIVNPLEIFAVLGILTAVGIFVSVWSTWRAMVHYLSLSLDELY
jgi:cell division transport system permease protein